MRIGLIDVDGHNFPNIPLMKISAWHKANGDSVEWYDPLVSGHMDKVYLSKVFSFTKDYEYAIDADEIVRGGSGYCISLINGREVYDQSKDPRFRLKLSTLIPITRSMIFQALPMAFFRVDALADVVSVTSGPKRLVFRIRLRISMSSGTDKQT